MAASLKGADLLYCRCQVHYPALNPAGSVLHGFNGAPGRSRTRNQPGRNRLLYPLSYGGLTHILAYL